MKRRVALAAACALLAGQVSLAAETDAPRVRRLLSLLRGVEQEYLEAFDDHGSLVRPIELEEAAMLLSEARDVAQALAADLPDARARVMTLSRAVEDRVPVPGVVATCREIRAAIVEASGVTEEVLPPQPPSASAGAALYGAHCVSCHGASGAGDGADAARLKRRPPDFADAAFMRAETPTDLFLVISLGRRAAEMPAWEQVLSVQERWDLVSYLWFLHSGSDAIGAGQGRFLSGCAPCHMSGALAAGAESPLGTRPVPLNDLPSIAGKSDTALATAIRASPAHASIGSMGDADRWNLVAFVRTLSLGQPADRGDGAAPVDRDERLRQSLARVEKGVADAVDAYRLHETEASALAMNAYLAFEPLEPGIAASDPGAVGRVEAEFVRLHQAIRQPDSLKEVEAVANAVKRALGDLKIDARRGASMRGYLLAAVAVGALLGAVVLMWRRT